MPDTHIKMPDVAPLLRFTADGVTTSYTYTFPIFASEDMIVSLDGAEQASGFTVNNAGETTGGTVVFSTAPASGIIITLERRLPFERLSDFLESGSFAAQTINSELDYLTALVQQVARNQSEMLRYSEDETTAETILPARATRSNKVLGFDGDGDPITYTPDGITALPDYTATGTGAATRNVTDKLKDVVSVKDFGATGDGLTDDTLAIQNALQAHDSVYLPSGTYLISATIEVGDSKSLLGAGQSSIIEAMNNTFNTIELPAGYATLANFRIENGLSGILLRGADGPCVQNSVSDIVIEGATTGIILDGYDNTNKPCYWNNFARVLVLKPTLHGVHLTKTSSGDTPNANRFLGCRVYSLGASTTGAGFYIEHGKFNNTLTDCEANVAGTAAACFHIGANTEKNLLVNVYAESTNTVSNVLLDSGSLDTAIFNLLAASDGAAIEDNSGGNYNAFNAGFPEKNLLRKTAISDLTSTLQRYDTIFIDTSGTLALDLAQSVHLVSSFDGALTLTLPNASDAEKAMVFIKKIDASENLITIEEDSGNGPDGRIWTLGNDNDHVMMMSNGAEWFVMGSNRMAGGTRFIENETLHEADLSVDVYLVSGFFGATTFRLPPADAAESIGRTVVIKKTDSSSNAITITEQGGSGPDQSSQTLTSQYNAITVTSNGAEWYIVSTY